MMVVVTRSLMMMGRFLRRTLPGWRLLAFLLAQPCGHFGDFFSAFGHPIFAEMVQPGLVSLDHRCQRVSFSYRHQRDLFGLTSGSLRGGLHPLIHYVDIG